MHLRYKAVENIMRKGEIARYINPLPDDKILDWSKLKQIADNILKCITSNFSFSHSFPQLYIFSVWKCIIA